MKFLFHAHSGLRYLVLLAGLAALAYFIFGRVTQRPAGKGVRVFGAIFVGLLDLQVLLGIIMVVMGRYYPLLVRHIVAMLAASLVAHVLLKANRKRPTPGYELPILAVVGALVCIVIGIIAIGRGVFSSTGFTG